MKTSGFSWAACLVVVSSIACNREVSSSSWAPVSERTAIRSVRMQVERATRDVDAALMTVESRPEDSALFLRAADRALKHLLDFYAPMIEACESSLSAYQHFDLGDINRAELELIRVEYHLQAIAQANHGELDGGLKIPMEALADARSAVRAGSEKAPELLHSLTIRLNNFTGHGGLIVD